MHTADKCVCSTQKIDGPSNQKKCSRPIYCFSDRSCKSAEVQIEPLNKSEGSAKREYFTFALQFHSDTGCSFWPILLENSQEFTKLVVKIIKI